MGINKKQLKEFIQDTLDEFKEVTGLNVNTEHAVNLLLGTAAQESGFGKYIVQLESKIAKGIFQIEPSTFKYLIETYARKMNGGEDNPVYAFIRKYSLTLEADELMWNLKLSVIMCRLRYWVIREKLPTTLDGYARYWKKYYNTPLGAGTEKEFIENYKKYVI